MYANTPRHTCKSPIRLALKHQLWNNEETIADFCIYKEGDIRSLCTYYQIRERYNSVSIREDKGRNFKPSHSTVQLLLVHIMEFKEASITRTENHDSTKLETKSPANGSETKNDCSTFGQSLIKFMSLATGSVKMALQKPANYKKNINHRRYLQKQLKICTRRKRRNTKCKSAAAAAQSKKTPPEAQRFMPAAEVWLRGHQGMRERGGLTFARQGAGNEILPLQGNACLPFEASFHTSNGVLSSLECSLHDLPAGNNNQVAFFAPHSVGGAQHGRDLSHLNNVNGSTFRDDLLLPEVVMEETESFLTGEELTRALDIKDLFVPDRNEGFEGGAQEIEAGFSYSSVDKTVFSDFNVSGFNVNGFQTIPSTTNIISW